MTDQELPTVLSVFREYKSGQKPRTAEELLAEKDRRMREKPPQMPQYERDE